MPEPFIGEIRIFPHAIVPAGWVPCDGHELSVGDPYALLFDIIGTTYGGDGTNVFTVPDLRSRMPAHPDDFGQQPGTTGGEEAHTLTPDELPQHAHTVAASSSGGRSSPGSNLPGASGASQYATGSATAFAAKAVSRTGHSVPHENRSPFLTLAFCIAYEGVMPVHGRTGGSTNYIGEIRMFAGNFAPAGWMFCQGQQLQIGENDVLYLLIGTTYGGDGETTFNLPNLSGRVPIHTGQGPGLSLRTLAESGGQSGVVLTTSTIPAHTHSIDVRLPDGTSASPSGAVLASDPVGKPYAPRRRLSGSMSAGAFASSGLGAPHENRPPFFCVNFIISMFGTFPPPP